MAFINKEDIGLAIVAMMGYYSGHLVAKTNYNYWGGLLIGAGSMMVANAVFRHLGYEGRNSFEENLIYFLKFQKS